MASLWDLWAHLLHPFPCPKGDLLAPALPRVRLWGQGVLGSGSGEGLPGAVSGGEGRQSGWRAGGLRLD